MSKVFRRPMFRGGSTNMNGIMSGIEDRENYAEGTNSERYKKVFDQYSAPAVDPVSQLLIQGGLRGLSETRGGGTLANMSLAFEKPAEQLMSNLQQRKNAERDMALAGLGMDIEDERAREARIQKVKDMQEQQLGKERIAQMKIDAQKKLVEMELGVEGLFSTKDFFEEYGSKVQAENRKDYENLGLESKANEAFGQSYEGFIGGKHGRLSDYEKKGNIGKVYYDVTDGVFKRLRKTAEGYEYEPLDLATFDPEEDKSKQIPKEKFPGEQSKNPGYRRPPKEFNIKEVDPFDPYSGA